MKKILFAIFFFACLYNASAQSVGIGTTTPNASAQLDIVSTTKGLLIPRMTGAQRAAIPAAAVGMLVIQTNTETSPPSSPGLYLREQVGLSQVWRRIARTDEITSGTPTWTVNGIDQYSNVAGNVGIGTSTGLVEKLSVKGNIFVTHVNPSDLVNGGNRAELNLHGAASGIGVVNFLKSDTSIGARIFYGNTLQSFVLQNNSNSNQLYLDDNGRIGIGTSSPAKRLDVVGSIRSRDTITADDDIEAGVDIRAGDDIIATGSLQGSYLYVTGSGLIEGQTTILGNINGSSNASINGSITTNAGITINDAAGIIQFKTAGNDKGFVQLNGDDLRIGTNSSNINGKFVVRTGGSDQFFVDAAGYVGVGVSGPGAFSRFHIGTGLDASLTSNGYMMLGNITGSNLVFDNNEILARGANGTVGNLVLQHDGGTVRIGNVAVPSGYKFAINGKMICEELKVKLASSGWPDYVFADKYKLRPLADVEKFIQQNKHLPNIPSAAEVEKNGIEVGDMQHRMMEKIEELTLYIIEQNKRIAALENLLPVSTKK